MDAPEQVVLVGGGHAAAAFVNSVRRAGYTGRLTLIGFLGGAKGQLNLTPLLTKSLTVRATTLRRTPASEKEELVRVLGAFALDRFARGELKPVVDSVFTLGRAAEAHRAMEANRNLGKIVLKVD